MAVNPIPVGCDAVALVENDKGNGVITRKYADVKPSASNDAIYDVMYGTSGLMRLQSRAVQGIQRVNVTELQDE